MRSRQAIGYVVQIDGVDITLNLMDVHRGQLAAHAHGVSVVTEVGSLLGIESGGRLLVMKVQSLSFAEPKEVHRFGLSGTSVASEPLRHLTGLVVGRLRRDTGKLAFVSDSLSSPALGAEAYPLTDEELSTILRSSVASPADIHLGDDLRGGGRLMVDLESLVSRHVAVLGSSGQGKSCFTAAVLQQVAKMPKARVVIFDINGEYEDAFPAANYPPGAIKVTRIGGSDPNSYRIPYYALGRLGLQRLLLPSDKTQRPALTFALDHLNKVKWFSGTGGAGLVTDSRASLFDDCRSDRVFEAKTIIESLRDNTAPSALAWPPMQALGPLIADSHAIAPARNGGFERSAWNYGNIAPLITRVARFVDDEMFKDVVSVAGGVSCGGPLSWRNESKAVVERLFGGDEVNWRVHIVDLRRVSHDLTPFVLGAVLELYAFELFRRGQENKRETLLVLEEAHHYLRQMGTGDEAVNNALAYERLAKEGRKFGLALWLSTQRPSEISPTVLSQCNTWVSFRLSSEKDLSAIQSASEWADKREVRRIAGLARRNALAFGGSLQMATLIKAPMAHPLPRSEDGRFNSWASDVSEEEEEGVDINDYL
ncbi:MULTISPECIES: anti-phage-associated helicase HerA [Xanthomonas]|uniref:anti-phage-associated helicase HerA n=1 Tax=Xanthomonas TaxID=338 RepID=UPI00053150B4|nr:MULTISPECIES: anti-phage-associated helicase HerA [Xanthomonas]KGR51715.1 ATPase [Xanthomonas vasicola]KGR52309.1 ATPase [Xanthomonas vasicola]KGT85668.1 ATPase [Xanthomonas vasicola]